MARRTHQAQEVEAAPVVLEGQNPISAAGYTLEQLQDQYKTKSATIRFLHSQGYKVGDIARFMGIIYQHARNVIKQKPKKAAPVETPTTE